MNITFIFTKDIILLDEENNPIIIPAYESIVGDLNTYKDELLFFYSDIPFELMYSEYEKDIRIIIQNIQSTLVNYVDINLN